MAGRIKNGTKESRGKVRRAVTTVTVTAHVAKDASPMSCMTVLYEIALTNAISHPRFEASHRNDPETVD